MINKQAQGGTALAILEQIWATVLSLVSLPSFNPFPPSFYSPLSSTFLCGFPITPLFSTSLAPLPPLHPFFALP